MALNATVPFSCGRVLNQCGANAKAMIFLAHETQAHTVLLLHESIEQEQVGTLGAPSYSPSGIPDPMSADGLGTMLLPTERKRAVVLPTVNSEGEDAVAVGTSLRSVTQESVG